MANAIPNTIAIERRARAVSRALPVPAIAWYVRCLVGASTSAIFGMYWDLSWHSTIGRDSFWTPPHMAVYLTGILTGIACGYTILTTTFGSFAKAKAASVRIWGLRGPLGCFVATWGACAMLISAPFDNWWHNAYGLDVAILTPPHALLSSGIAAVGFGAVLLLCSEINQAKDNNRKSLDRLLLYTLGVLVVGYGLMTLDWTWPGRMHNSAFYLAISAGLPALLVLGTQASGSRWAATAVASFYMMSFLLELWILPLFPAQPKLGPVYQHITHFVPLGFPLLLVVPAFAIDLLRRMLGDKWGSWKSIAPVGCVYFATILVAQWNFSYFLLSPQARNWVFGMAYFAYYSPANVLYDPYFFYTPEKTQAAFVGGMALALVAAIVSSGVGMGAGNWMRRIKR